MDEPSINWIVLEKLDNLLSGKNILQTIHILSCNQ